MNTMKTARHAVSASCFCLRVSCPTCGWGKQKSVQIRTSLGKICIFISRAVWRKKRKTNELTLNSFVLNLNAFFWRQPAAWGEKNWEVFGYQTSAETLKFVWMWMHLFFFATVSHCMHLLSKPSRFHNWYVCWWNSKGLSGNLAYKRIRRMPRCPQAFDSVSVTMIYNKALRVRMWAAESTLWILL